MSSSSSWIPIAPDSDFSLRNLPFGVVSRKNSSSARAVCATILGETVIDLSILEEAGAFSDIDGLAANTFCQSTLNAFLEHAPAVWKQVRRRLTELFCAQSDASVWGRYPDTLQQACLVPVSDIVCHLPIEVKDYTDFYSSREHATNVGTMFRGKDNALQPNWLHLPVGYHGRASTVFVSGTPVHRPRGQLQKDANDPSQGSVYGACRLLDFELEVAAVVGGKSPGGDDAGQPLTLAQAKERIFGFVLMNDWSARDIQKWEYVPLGPFTSKNFATIISPWIVTTDALEAFVAPTSSGPQQTEPAPLPYLYDPEYSSYDIQLTVAIQTEQQSNAHVVAKSNFTNLYWNAAQQLAHHSVTGCIMQAGDLLGSGTISGQDPGSYGSMLELSWKGSKEVSVGDEVRKFLKDGDTVVMKGMCVKSGHDRMGFGECTGKVLPARTETTSDVLEADGTKGEAYKDFKLYSYWRSSSSWRVRMALACKGVPYETIPVDITKDEHRAKEYLAMAPLGQVPVLEFTDCSTGKKIYMSQSVAIIEFLEEAFPGRVSLLPKDPLTRALAREMLEVVNAGTQPLQNVILLRDLEKQSEGKIKADERARIVNENGMRALETLVVHRRPESAGPFCLGTFSPSIVDAFMVPQLYNARRFGVNVEEVCPKLAEIEKECLAHPWFQLSHPDAQPDAPK